MHRDCSLVCSQMAPRQVERASFRAPATITATHKGRQPFAMWCIDLVTKLEPAGRFGESICAVAVCPFSKWVEAAPLTDRSSTTTMQWLHASIVCRYGVPWGIRADQGTEFKGAFRDYCAHLGI